MSANVDDLIVFYRARLDEDEQAALDWQRHKAALTEQFMNDPRRQHVRLRREPVTEARLSEYAYRDRFDPARVLREVEAKRLILDERKQGRYGECVACDVGAQSCGCCGWGDFPCSTVRLLALPYADHEGYREEWKP